MAARWRSALHASIWDSEETHVARLLASGEGIDVNEKDRRGFSPLCRAVQKGRLAITGRLLSHEGVDVLACDGRGRSALFWAAQYGTPELAGALLSRGAKVTETSENGRSPLMQALQNRNAARMVQTLLQHGDWNPSVRGRHSQKSRAFADAVKQNRVAAVGVFLDDGEDVNGKHHRCDPSEAPWQVLKPATPLMLAAERGYEKMVRLLLHRGAEVNTRFYCSSALSDALRGGHETIVRLLMEHGATARLSDAVAANDVGLARQLLDEGADANETTGGFETPLLTWACQFNHEEIARLLVEHSADVNRADTMGQTPLSAAARQDNLPLVRFLVERGADPLALDKNQKYAVALAAAVWGRKGDAVARWLLQKYGLGPDKGAAALNRLGRPDVMRLLIAAGADVNAPTAYLKRTPLGWAVLHRASDIVPILLEAGATVSVRDRDGNTPLSLAAGRGSVKTIRLVLETGKVEPWDLNRALIYAASGGHDEAKRLLAAFGADPNGVLTG